MPRTLQLTIFFLDGSVTVLKLTRSRRSLMPLTGTLSLMTVLRIPDPNFYIQDPGSRIKKIPDPGSRGLKDTGSRIRICNIVGDYATSSSCKSEMVMTSMAVNYDDNYCDDTDDDDNNGGVQACEQPSGWCRRGLRRRW